MLVAFAGCDGVGKTSIISCVRRSLEQQGFRVKALKPISQENECVREIARIKQGYIGNPHDVNTKTRLIIAYATYLASKAIEKDMEEYDYVLLDRWTLCQRVYATVWQNEDSFADHILDQCIRADVTILIDGDENMVNKHIESRAEREEIENKYALRRILRTYRKFAKKDSNIQVVVNREGEMEEAVRTIVDLLVGGV